MWLQRFASNQNFLIPQLTEDGKPYGPKRYGEIAKECYLISKHTHTSYNEVLEISPMERQIILKNITDDLQKQSDQIKELEAKRKQKQ